MQNDNENFCDRIFRGLIYPCEDITKNNAAYRTAANIASESESELRKTFDNSQKELYEKAIQDFMSAEDVLISTAFKMGIKYAVNLLTDINNINL